MHEITLILGCTGVGKSEFGLALAERLGAEILCLDSMQIYRRMNIGTAKPTAEEQRRIPHHLLDLIEPWETYSVARFVEHAEAAIRDVAARGRRVVAVGGTSLYIKALTEGLFEGPGADAEIRARLKEEAHRTGKAALHARLRRVDPLAAERIHVNDLRRVVRALEVHELTGTPISSLQTQWDRQRTRHAFRFIGLRRTREDQNRRTNERVRQMIQAGLVEEVRGLLSLPHPLSRTASRALGYAEILEYLGGRASLEEAVENIKINTRQFAKSQRTWFKRFREVQWIDLAPGAEAGRVIQESRIANNE